MHNLQLFLQEHTNTSNLDQCFDDEIEYFRSLCITNDDTSAYSDIFPDTNTDIASRIKTFERVTAKSSSY